MWRWSTLLLLAGLFAAASGIVYLVHYAIFQDTHHIFIFLLGDLAFLPLEAFLVVVVIERLLTRREKRSVRQKLNMVVGAFFSEVGTLLLRELLDCFQGRDEITRQLSVHKDWSKADFKKAVAFATGLRHQPDCRNVDLDDLKALLVAKRGFLLRLLENPNLLEHERFTEVLWATFHLTEELESRESFEDLPPTDLSHISLDIERLYTRLAAEWLYYVEHLKSSYPFLFSLVTRMHPFQEAPSAVVRE